MGKLFEQQEDGSLKPIEVKPTKRAIQIAVDYLYLKEKTGDAAMPLCLLELIHKDSGYGMNGNWVSSEPSSPERK
jgi:hypothetical protein